MSQWSTNIHSYLVSQIEFSRETFGPGPREEGVLAHIAKELKEVAAESDPDKKLEEWIDVIILAFDGAWRCAQSQTEIDSDTAILVEETIHRKFDKNRQRTWPDWRDSDPSKPIEHNREEEAV